MILLSASNNSTCIKAGQASLFTTSASSGLFKALGTRMSKGEILREKLCLRNTDGCTCAILLNFPTFSAFAVSRIDFYLLAKRNTSRET